MYYTSLSSLTEQVLAWKKEGKSIVFTNGVFDILHVGHADYLLEAKKLGDVLIVGINDDRSVRLLNKGPERPINDEISRAKLVAHLGAVDATIIFSEETPFQLIQNLIPDVLVKGGDYDPNEMDPSSKKYMVGSDIVKKNGGKVIAISLTPGYSTTSVVSRILYK